VSDDTKDALEAALAAHFADEFDGAIASAWIIQVYGNRIDTTDGYYLTSWPEGQPLHTTAGLIEYASRRQAARIVNVDDADDDDD
jgi:hypothetical protein